MYEGMLLLDHPLLLYGIGGQVLAQVQKYKIIPGDAASFFAHTAFVTGGSLACCNM